LAIWKHHEKEGERMTLHEILESGAGRFMGAGQFAKSGITLVDNTPAEIEAVVSEMADMVDGKSYPDAQKWFWDGFPVTAADGAEALHGHIRMRIGRDFLRGYEHAGWKADFGTDTGAGGIEAGAVQEHHGVSREAADPVDARAGVG
jgi:hypothetical protein